MWTALFALCLNTQTFTPNLPDAIPAVQGSVSEPFTMRYIDVESGTGAAAQAGQRYIVHYTGWLRDGKKFDSSRDRDKSFSFVQGRRQVISGWEVGFEGMHVGGKRRLFIPYQMAYGEKGRNAIPPRSELIFDVELLAVETAPEAVAAAEILDPLAELEKKVMALAKAVPEEKYDWHPAPGVRSFREVFLHIASGNDLLLELAEKSLTSEELNARIEKQSKVSKVRVVEMLASSFEGVRKKVAPLAAGALGSDILFSGSTFSGSTTTRRGVYIRLDNHVSEHLGQLIAYARMAGIVPPWVEN